jgi:hypothetical protein
MEWPAMSTPDSAAETPKLDTASGAHQHEPTRTGTLPPAGPPFDEVTEKTLTQEMPSADRLDPLTACLEREAARGYSIETRSETQAIISRSSQRWPRFRKQLVERRLVTVDESGRATSRPLEQAKN